MIPDGRTPVVVVTGFLGSGKTTLVNRLVKATDSLVIVNEYGEVPVDHVLIESSVEKAVALPNGCLCCHMRGDLEETLMGAAMRRRRGEIAGFDRVIVETSGLADPGPVAQTLYADPALQRDFKLGPIVTVVDAFDLDSRKASLEIARAQIAAADVVVLSKVDRGTSAAAEAEVRSLNPTVRCIPADHGNVDPEEILEAKPGTGHDFSARPAHGSAIRSFVLHFDAPVRRELLQQFLGTLVELRGKDLLRVKGVVPVEGGKLLVQGVRHVFARLQPVERGEPALVFITNGIEQGEVEALWRAMKGLS
ncbi:MAG TPA: GTP-binding protein [Burkholderiales bacterium]|nr:GTP-binding protein [Burkholderiales bacterium]